MPATEHPSAYTATIQAIQGTALYKDQGKVTLQEIGRAPAAGQEEIAACPYLHPARDATKINLIALA